MSTYCAECACFGSDDGTCACSCHDEVQLPCKQPGCKNFAEDTDSMLCAAHKTGGERPKDEPGEDWDEILGKL